MFFARNFHLRKSLQQKTLISIRTHALKMIVFFTPDEKLFFLFLKVFLFLSVAEDSALAKLTRIMNENCGDFACNLPKLIRWIRWDMSNYPNLFRTAILSTKKTKHAKFFLTKVSLANLALNRDSQRGIWVFRKVFSFIFAGEDYLCSLSVMQTALSWIYNWCRYLLDVPWKLKRAHKDREKNESNFSLSLRSLCDLNY